MTFEEKCAALRKMSLFATCTDIELESIASDFSYKAFKKHTLTIESEAARHRLYLIANNGRMKVSVTNPVTAEDLTVYMLSFGDVFNVMTLIDDEKDYLTAHALDDIEIFYSSMELARHWIQKCPCFSRSLLKHLSKRLRQVQDFNIQRTFYSIEMRLAVLIFQNICGSDAKVNLLNDLPHSELAKMLGTTRAVVNRNLQKLKKDGLIDIRRKNILVEDYERLWALIKSHQIS